VGKGLSDKRNVGRTRVVVRLVVDEVGSAWISAVGIAGMTALVAVVLNDVVGTVNFSMMVGGMLLEGCMVQSNIGLDTFYINQS
jgi:hypothetical protein